LRSATAVRDLPDRFDTALPGGPAIPVAKEPDHVIAFFSPTGAGDPAMLECMPDIEHQPIANTPPRRQP